MILDVSSARVNESLPQQGNPAIVAASGEHSDPGEVDPGSVSEAAFPTDNPTSPGPTNGKAMVPASEQLAQLATSINEHHTQAAGFTRQALEHARITGEKLLEAKMIVGHGQLNEWVKQQCRFSPRTAQRYMRVARNWSRLASNATRVTLFSISDAVRELSDTEDANDKEDADGEEDANDEESTDDEESTVASDDGDGHERGSSDVDMARLGNPVTYILDVLADGQGHPPPTQWKVPPERAVSAWVFECPLSKEQNLRQSLLAESTFGREDEGLRVIRISFSALVWAGLVEQIGDDKTPIYRLVKHESVAAEEV